MLAQRLGERRLQQRGRLVVARRHGQQDGRGRRPADERDERLDRRGVGPVEVVEAQDERAGGREPLEQIAQGAVRPVAVGGGRLGRERGQGGERARQRSGIRQAEAVEPPAGQVPVQRLGEDGVRQVALEGGGPRLEDGAAGGGRLAGEMREQAGLADPGFALDEHDAPGSRDEGGQRPREQLALARAAHQHGRRCVGHAPILPCPG